MTLLREETIDEVISGSRVLMSRGGGLATWEIPNTLPTSLGADGTVLQSDGVSPVWKTNLDLITDGGSTEVTLTAYAAAAGQITFKGQFSRGDLATPVVVNDGDVLVELIGQGHDATAFIDAAAIRFEVDGASGTNDMPGRIVFLTTPDGTAALVEAMRIAQSGNIGIGGASGTGSNLVTIESIAQNTRPLRIQASNGNDLIHLINNDAAGDALIQMWKDSNTTSVLTTQIYSDGDSYFNGGNVGIGLTAPLHPLHIQTNTDPQVVIEALSNVLTHITFRTFGSDQWSMGGGAGGGGSSRFSSAESAAPRCFPWTLPALSRPKGAHCALRMRGVWEFTGTSIVP